MTRLPSVRRVNVLYLLAVALFLATVVFTVVNTGSTDQTGLSRSASVYDEGPGGTAVLRRWLDDLGVRTRVVQGDRFQPAAEGAKVLLLLGATEPVTPGDVGPLRDFVSSGGTLVVATEAGIAETLLLDAYGVRLTGFAPLGEHETVGPAMAVAKAHRISIDRGRELGLGDRGLPVARTARAPLAAAVRDGAGVVYVVGSLAPFLSGQLADAENGRFVLALVDSAVRSGAPVAFDEYHHGAHPAPDVLAVVTRTWPGRAAVLAGILLFAYVALTGRRLGPPLPLEHRPSRSSLDHVRAFAGLVRRSGHGEIARERLRRELRHGLARDLGLDPGSLVPPGGTRPERLFNALAHVSPEREREARELDRLLARPLRDADLLRTVRRIDRILGTTGTTGSPLGPVVGRPETK